jgi:pyruvate-ferredoxin/flavodoxin oxidoreductase
VNNEGRGPAWASSLFEDNAEYGYGMQIGYSRIRERALQLLYAYSEKVSSKEASDVMAQWLLQRDDPEASAKVFDNMVRILEADNSPNAKEILRYKDFLRKRSVWAIGGDGWAYDIGYGGLDHVIAANEKINLLVMDTEVYSNTGGQSSKSTPTAAIAKFAASGKRTRKKDLGMMAISYGYVYVAQVAMGANQSQFLKAVKEAEEYQGPSLIIAYSPCINHGIRSGMQSSQTIMKNAVQCGYWHLYRYNPMLEAEGKNPFTLDSKEPEWEKFRGFLMNETRYTSLRNEFPDTADELFKKAEEDARRRYLTYKRMASDIA